VSFKPDVGHGAPPAYQDSQPEDTTVKIALISEHASPLAATGSVDSGGQNIYVANVARQLARKGHHVDVFTRCDRSLLPLVSRLDGARVINVPAGPKRQLPKEQLLPYMEDFANFVIGFFRHEPSCYDVVHANFFMSGLVGLRVKESLGIPLVTTFHALGRVRRLRQGADDGFPDIRFEIEDKLVRDSDSVIAECPQDESDLVSLYQADSARIDLVPCGFDHEEFHPVDKRAARAELEWPQDRFIALQLGRMVPRKGVDTVVRAVGLCNRTLGEEADLYVVGGNSDEANEISFAPASLLQRGRRIRHNALVRTVRHYPVGSDGLQYAGDRRGRWRHSLFCRAWRDGIARAAEGPSGRRPRAGHAQARPAACATHGRSGALSREGDVHVGKRSGHAQRRLCTCGQD
jgi:glycosyltransferase involved in cell wall biosynthesis